MQNRVVKMKPRKSVWDRVARSALVLCSNEEWLEVIAEAQDRGIIPRETLMRDIVAFNERASEFDGTVRELLAQP
jgi:hypothetical protein